MLNDLNHFLVHCARELPFIGSCTWVPGTTSKSMVKEASWHERGKWRHISLQSYQYSNQAGERKAMEEHVAEDVALVSDPVRRRRSHDDRLRVDHLSHDTARAVGSGHE